MSDQPVSEPAESVDRRALLRGILGSAAAVAGAAAVGAPNLARAAGAAATATPTCDARSFKLSEKEHKKDRQRELRRLGTREEEKKKVQRERLQRYATSGLVPLWMESDWGLTDVLTLEVEQSSIDSIGDAGFCAVTMDIKVDVLGGKASLKEALAPLYGLLPPAPGKESPFVTITWGVDGDQLFEGFLEKLAVAYTAYDEKGTPVIAVARATFYG